MFGEKEVRITVKVKPKSKERKIIKISDKEFIVYLKSEPKKGKANEELLRVLREYFGRNVRIVSGFTSRIKVIEIE